jgi:hypothetical protein
VTQFTIAFRRSTDTLKQALPETPMRHLTALALALALLSTASAADIYCNNQGKDCSDKPTPGAVLVHISASNYGSNTLSTPAQASASDRSAGNGSADSANSRLNAERSAQAVQKDVTTARATQCKDAQDKYQKSVEARRVYRVGKDGEREYLSDNEADQMRLNARLEMEQACGKSSG